MALQCVLAHLGDIGETQPEKEPDPDRLNEKEMECQQDTND